MADVVTITGLYKQFKQTLTPAVNGLNWVVKEKTIAGLLGPNGAGKSTTIHILCGLMKPEGGDVTITNNISLGFVPQQIALFEQLTVWENIRYFGALYDLRKEQVRKRGSELLEALNLTSHAHKQIKDYSGGMKRRANIIVSLLHNPALLILDEPTAGVDVQSRALILNFLIQYKEKGNTIIYTSHLLEEAQRICDSVAIIDEGKLIIEGSPLQLINGLAGAKNLEDVFLHYTGHSART